MSGSFSLAKLNMFPSICVVHKKLLSQWQSVQPSCYSASALQGRFSQMRVLLRSESQEASNASISSAE